MRKSWIIAGLIAVGATAWVASGQFADSSTPEDEAAETPDQPEAPPQMVRVRQVMAEPMLSDITVQGRTLADRMVTVKNEEPGRVMEVLVNRGDVVNEGDLLIRLDPEDREVMVESARALVTQRELEFAAARRLNDQGHSSDVTLLTARAALDAARAALRSAEIALANCDIYAPFSGVVDDRHVELGDYLDRGEAVATVVDLDPIRVVGQVSERYLGVLETGTIASVRLIDDRFVEGPISFIGSIADETTRTFRVEVEVPNADGQVIQGLTSELHLPIEEVTAHRIPASVLSLADDGTLGVKAVDAEDVVQFHPVRILGDSGSGIWLGGLPDAFQLIVVGQEFVLPGDRVEPVTVDEIAISGDQPPIEG